jgi:hypothetical protein
MAGAGVRITAGVAPLSSRVTWILAAALLLAAAVGAQTPTVQVDDLECLPTEGSAPVMATVTPDQPGITVRLYFRRLHDVVEDFYYVEMRPRGEGQYYGVFPRPESKEPEKHRLKDGRRTSTEWADWWKAKEASEDRDPNDDLDDEEIRERASKGKLESRDWMENLDEEELNRWLEDQEYEPAEYYATVQDAAGDLVAESAMKVVPVTDDCRVDLTPQEVGLGDNLTVGETAFWQEGKPVFHWLCAGVVTRIDFEGYFRPDRSCRACIIPWWKDPDYLVPLVVAGGGGAATAAFVGIDDDDETVSPSQP